MNKLLKKYNNIPIEIKASLWFMFCSITQKSVALITTPIFTRIMSTDQYGQFIVYNSWLQIFTILTTLRLNWAVFNKGMSKFKEDRDGYASTMQTLTACITLGVFAVYLIFNEQINAVTELPTFIMVAIFAELLVTPAVDFWTLRKRYEYIYVPIVIRTLLMVCLNASIGVLAVFFSDEKGYARILSCVAVNLFFGISLFIYNRRKGKIWFNKEYAWYAVSFNLPLLLHYFSQYVLDQFDRIMIQKMVSMAAAGMYGVAYNAGMLMKIVTQNIVNVLIPWQYEQLENRKLKELDDVLFLIYILVACAAIVFSAFAPELMMILADEEYHEAANVIAPIALGLVFTFMYTTFANVEFFYEQNKFTMYISMAGALLNVILNYFGIKMFGYVAAAYTTLICYALFAAGHYCYMTWSVKKVLGVDRVFDTGRLILLSAVVLFCGVSVIALYSYPLIRFGIVFVAVLIGWLKRNLIISVLKTVRKPKKK